MGSAHAWALGLRPEGVDAMLLGLYCGPYQADPKTKEHGSWTSVLSTSRLATRSRQRPSPAHQAAQARSSAVSTVAKGGLGSASLRKTGPRLRSWTTCAITLAVSRAQRERVTSSSAHPLACGAPSGLR